MRNQISWQFFSKSCAFVISSSPTPSRQLLLCDLIPLSSLQFAPLFTFFVGGISSSPPRSLSAAIAAQTDVLVLFHGQALALTESVTPSWASNRSRALASVPLPPLRKLALSPSSSSPLGELRFPCNRRASEDRVEVAAASNRSLRQKEAE